MFRPATVRDGLTSYLLSISTILVAGAVLGGCLVSFDFDRPALTPPPRTALERCVQANIIKVAGAKARWHESESEGEWTIVTTYRKGGVTFYRNGKRLTAKQVARILKGSVFSQYYLTELRNRRHRVKTLSTWAIVTEVITALSLGGMTAWIAMGEDLDSKPAMATIFSLAAVGLIGTMVDTIYLRPTWRREKVSWQIRKTIVTDKSYTNVLATALKRYNKAVVAYCVRRFGQTTVPSAPSPFRGFSSQ